MTIVPGNEANSSRAVAWASMETLLRHGLQFASGIVLARLLTPDDFGLVAMLVIFIGVAMTLADGGFASALIQQSRESDADSSTVFWYSLACGTLLALLVAVCAPWIAAFYGQPALVRLTWGMALNVWLASWLTVHVALLTRHLNFRAQAIASGISNLLGAVVGILLALYGAGAWALVFQALSTTLLNVILIWWLYPWRPTATFDTGALRRLFGFGGYMLASAILNAITMRFYALLIGRFHSGHDLGLYTRAVTTRDASQAMLGTIFSRVALPVLSRHGNDLGALRSRLRVGNQLTMAINLPAMVGLCMVANLAVPTLFGRQWLGTVPILQVLCVAGALWPLQVSNVQVMMAQGRSGKMFGLGVMKAIILVGSMLVASRWGMLAIAWATVFSAVMSLLLNTYHSHVLIGYGALGQIRDLRVYVLLTAGMILVVGISAHVFAWLTPGKRLLVEVASGAGFYVGLAVAMRLPAVAFALEVIRSFRVRREPGHESPTSHASR